MQLWLELERASGPLNGRLHDKRGEVRQFSGWLGLLQALTAALAEGSAASGHGSLTRGVVRREKRDPHESPCGDARPRSLSDDNSTQHGSGRDRIDRRAK